MTPPPYPVIRLKPKIDARAIRHGAPWVFDNELVTDRRTRALSPGSIAVLEDAERAPLGQGLRLSDFLSALCAAAPRRALR